MSGKKDKLGYREPRDSTGEVLAGAVLDILTMAPSVVLGAYLRDKAMPLQFAYFVSCTILLLAVFNFATVIFIAKSGRNFAWVTMPALLSVISIIFMFVVMESLNRFYPTLGYRFATPFVALVVLLVYAGIFVEKSRTLKLYLGINAAAPMLLWAMSMSGRVVMPF
jgi:hypothetical protein